MSIPRLHPLASGLLLAALLLAGCAAPATRDAGPLPSGRDAFMVISGGGTPLSNNYSQYLQARALAGHLQATYPAGSTWVFFGIGNRPEGPAILADARRQVRRDGRLLESWEPGPLPGNRPATRAAILGALRDEILPRVRDGGTLYLFVGDHGTLSKGKSPESEITLWELKRRQPDRPDSWYTDTSEHLTVSELRAALAAGLGRGRVVFCMTQCHSGGFHYLGVPRELVPPSDWFSAVPEWASRAPVSLGLRVAGFTATDEESLAAGCDPDPDPEKWAGYERFLPERLLGLDLFTGRPKGSALGSFAAAHEAATLDDRTIDKPRATSDQYLERWAAVIERMGGELLLTPAAHQALANYRRAVDTGRVEAADAAFAAGRAHRERLTRRLAEQAPAASTLLLEGTRAELEGVIGAAGTRPGSPGGGRNRGAPAEDQRKAWKEVLRPAWKAAALGGEVPGLAGAALEFERRLLQLEDQGREFMLARGWQNPLLNELYWRSGYSDPATLDRAKAEAVTAWGADRRTRILAWGRASAAESVRAAAEVLGGARRAPAPVAAGSTPPPNLERPLSRRTAAERVLFYRRTLAAWAFLLELNHREALAELRELIALERTPLPAAADVKG